MSSHDSQESWSRLIGYYRDDSNLPAPTVIHCSCLTDYSTFYVVVVARNKYGDKIARQDLRTKMWYSITSIVVFFIAIIILLFSQSSNGISLNSGLCLICLQCHYRFMAHKTIPSGLVRILQNVVSTMANTGFTLKKRGETW